MLNFNTLDYLPEELADESIKYDFGYHRELRAHAFMLIDPRLTVALEFGVADGTSFKQFARLLHGKQVLIGFDGFAGFPTNWDWGDGVRNTPAGKAVGSYREPAPSTQIIEGWFADTLPAFKPPGRVGFIHIDCDVYESTLDVFRYLDPYIEDGTVIVFDEISGYPNYEQHEYKALCEWREATGMEIEWVAISTDVPEDRPHELHAAAGICRLPQGQQRRPFHVQHSGSADDTGSDGISPAEE